VFAPIVIVEAAVQAALVLPDPTPAWSWSFIGLVAVSAVAVLVAVWLVVVTASAVLDEDGPFGPDRALRRPGVLGWALVVGILAVAAAGLEVWLAPLVMLIGGFVLPPAARGDRRVLVVAWRPFRHRPLRTALHLVAAVLLVAVSWVIALVCGFFVTGSLGAAVMWLWFGLAATYVLCQWSAVYARVTYDVDQEIGQEKPARSG
jgi:hypothetical protein